MQMTSLARCSNWPAALQLFIEEKRNQPFDWQHNNCAFFASDWLAILTGEDPAAHLREQVTSALSAARVLKDGGGIEAMFDEYCTRQGWLVIEPNRAQRGDLATIAVNASGVAGTEDASDIAVGVVVGLSVAYAGPNGVTFAPRAIAGRAWRIG